MAAPTVLFPATPSTPLVLPTEVPVAWGSKFDPLEVGIACPANVLAALDAIGAKPTAAGENLYAL